jgi:Domain of unknown function (DUF4402)
MTHDFKNLTRRLLIAVGLIASATGALAQSSANGTGTATATVIRPITISAPSAPMAFGNIVATVAGGTVDLTAAAVATTTATGVSQPAGAPGLHTAATFTVGGEGGFTYAITLPAAPVSIAGPASAAMTVSGFISSTLSGIATLSGAIGSAGTDTLYVGGTLNVGANQTAGSYSGTFPVTVAYN